MSLFISAATFLIVAVTFLLNRATAKVQGQPRLAVAALIIAIFCFAAFAVAVVLGVLTVMYQSGALK